MASINYTTGTTIGSAWLNDVNTVAYTYFGNGANLNSPSKLTVAQIVTTSNLVFGGDSAVFGSTLTDSGTKVLVRGTSKAIRLGTSVGSAGIEAVDNTGVASYQPLIINGSTIDIGIAGVPRITVAASGAVTIPVSVATPQVGSASGSLNVSPAGNIRWTFFSSGVLAPNGDNTFAFGDPSARISTGYFGTSVVLPFLDIRGVVAPKITFTPSSGATRIGGIYQSGDTLFLAQDGVANRLQLSLDGGIFGPSANDVTLLGQAGGRWLGVFTGVVDTGSTGSLTLRTNNGTTQVRIAHVAATNPAYIQGGVSSMPLFGVDPTSTDANVDLGFFTKGSGTIHFQADGTGTTQFQVLRTASANRNITVTGSNGGNPTLSVTTGKLAITPDVVMAGNLIFTAATSKIIPGATQLSLRNNADSADNLVIADTGTGTFRSSLVWGTGVANFGTIVRRKTADESLASSTVLQDDDHLTFSIAANEEWVGEGWISFGTAISATGFKVAATTPSGSTLLFEGVRISDTADPGTAQGGFTTTSGTTIFAQTPTVNNIMVKFHIWVLNGATPGSVTLQWAQNTSSATNLTARKGSFLQVTRIA